MSANPTTRYGWAIVAAMLAVQTVSSGLGFYNMSVYMNQFTRVLEVPLADVSFAVTLFFISGGVAGMYVATLLDRIHVRWIMVVGALICGGALGLVGFVDAVWQLYALFVIFGIGNTGVSLVVATTLITQWFPGRNRSIALSIASTGLSLGGVLVTPLTAHLLNQSGLTFTMPLLAVMCVVLIVPIALLVVRPAPPRSLPGAASGETEWVYSAAVRTRFFVCLTAGYVLIMAAQVGGIAHIYNRVDEIAGYAIAANSVQVLTLASITGRVLGGLLVTRISTRYFTLFNICLQVAGLASIGYASDTTSALLAAGVFGVCVGNLLMLQPLWLADAFPGALYARMFALSNALAVAGVAFGPYLMGLVYDAYDYRVSFLVAVAISGFALVVVALAGKEPRRPSDCRTL